MSRYADVDVLMQSIRHKLGIASLDNLLESEKAIVQEIDSAPSIDIVRCGECKHREEYPCKVYHDDDWYCADGEREGE